MVKADALYQIHMRLQEIKQNKKDFGGVSVLLFGDLMQLPPVMAAKIFSPPWNKKFQEYHKVNPLWELFDCIELTFNHRQGLDKEYGDMLNRIRKTEQTEDDLKVLASRICKEKPLMPGMYMEGIKHAGITTTKSLQSFRRNQQLCLQFT